MSRINPQDLQDNEVVDITADEVVRKRQTAIMGDVMKIDDRITALTEELKSLRVERAERIMEYDIWERYEDRGIVTVTTTTTTSVSGRMGTVDRVKFEDALKGIMREAGRPLKFGDICNRLERFGFQWSKKANAHNYITRVGLLESAGMHGYYQLIRP